MTVKAEAGEPVKYALDAEDYRSYREALSQPGLIALCSGDKADLRQPSNKNSPGGNVQPISMLKKNWA